MKRSIIFFFCIAFSFHLFAQNESEKEELMMKLLMLKTALIAKGLTYRRQSEGTLFSTGNVVFEN